MPTRIRTVMCGSPRDPHRTVIAFPKPQRMDGTDMKSRNFPGEAELNLLTWHDSAEDLHLSPPCVTRWLGAGVGIRCATGEQGH